MIRHLQPVGPHGGGPWFLSTRDEIDVFFAERWATLRGMLEAERRARASEPEQAQLDLERAA